MRALLLRGFRLRLLGLAILCLAGEAATAQTVTDPATQSLPDWAAPSVPSAAPASAGVPPDPPAAPPQAVPLDGGLTLLALAGGAYAARRLRRRETV